MSQHMMANSLIPELVSETPHKRVEFVAFSCFKHWGEKRYWEKFIYVKQALKCDRDILVRKRSYTLLSSLFFKAAYDSRKLFSLACFCLNCWYFKTLGCEITEVAGATLRDMAHSSWQRSVLSASHT